MTTTETTMRTQDEIAQRIHDTRASDTLNWKIEVLIEGVDFEHAEPWRNEELTADDWHTPSAEDLQAKARSYFEFAIGKAVDHRGISAERSTIKLAEYAWLLCRDDAVTAMNEAPYSQYGAPKLKAFGQAFGWWPEDPGDDITRMANGHPCEPGCDSGCGQ